MRRARLKIELKSDLCAGSGYSYAGIIDSDICYDRYGIPYIPARRLKGCMRMAAEQFLYSVVGQEEIEKLFGVAGNNYPGQLRVGNAVVANYHKLVQELDSFIMKHPSWRELLSKQNILDCYSCIKEQTKLQDGVAQKNSLRFTRVIDRDFPFADKNMFFEAELVYEAEQEDVLNKIVSSVRNIGMMRNRGMGSVKCMLTDCIDISNKKPEESTNEREQSNQSCAIEEPNSKHDSEEICRLDFMIENIEPLMLEQTVSSKSEKYINGQSVIGMFASRYLAQEGKTAESREFADLFLNGLCKYTNLYVSDGSMRYIPAPKFIAKLKKTKKLVNQLKLYEAEQMPKEYQVKNGNQPKKLKGQFVTLSEQDELQIREVNMRLVYHHSHRGKNRDGREGLLYELEVISEGQYFAGSVYAPYKYCCQLQKMMNQDDLHFGKSRNTQYGKCRLVSADIMKLGEKVPYGDAGQFRAEKGEWVAVVLASDAIFMTDTDYSIAYDEVYPLIAKELGIKYMPTDEQKESERERMYSIIETRKISGYHSQWNMTRPPVPAMAAGSTFLYQLQEDAAISQRWIGERTQEGYGEIRVYPIENIPYALKEKDNSSIKKRNAETLAELRPLLKCVLTKSMVEQMRLSALEESRFRLKSSTLGRVTLMLKESVNDYRNDSVGAFKDFYKRVESIKRKPQKEEMEKKLLERVAEKETDDTDDQVSWNLKYEKILKNAKIMGFAKLLEEAGFMADEIQQLVMDQWKEYIGALLLNQKYILKMGGVEL